MHIGTGLLRHLRHHIDSSQQRGSAKDAPCRSFQHFDTLNVTDVNRKIKGIMSRLGFTDIDAVEQDGDLL